MPKMNGKGLVVDSVDNHHNLSQAIKSLKLVLGLLYLSDKRKPHGQLIGLLGELVAAEAFLSAGYKVDMTGGQAQSDFVVEKDGRRYAIDVKTSSIKQELGKKSPSNWGWGLLSITQKNKLGERHQGSKGEKEPEKYLMCLGMGDTYSVEYCIVFTINEAEQLDKSPLSMFKKTNAHALMILVEPTRIDDLIQGDKREQSSTVVGYHEKVKELVEAQSAYEWRYTPNNESLNNWLMKVSPLERK